MRQTGFKVTDQDTNDFKEINLVIRTTHDAIYRTGLEQHLALARELKKLKERINESKKA